MVAANLELGKLKEAAACARESLSVMPRSAQGYISMGMVFSVSQPNSPEVSLCEHTIKLVVGWFTGDSALTCVFFVCRVSPRTRKHFN